jgi:hypothetical protein
MIARRRVGAREKKRGERREAGYKLTVGLGMRTKKNM